MEKQPLISVIVPVYNVEKYLPECIESINAQTYKNIEVLLIDDGSTDSSGQICDKVAKGNTCFKVFHKQNGGLSDARNFGIEKASGKWLTFVDSDDYISKDCIEYLLNLAITTDSKIAAGAHTTFYESGNRFYKGFEENSVKVLSEKEALNHILLDDYLDLSAWAKLYAVELFEDIRFPKTVSFEDTATTYKLFFLCDKIVCGGKSVYNYRIRSNSITTSGNFHKKIQLIENTKKMCSDITAKYPDLSQAADRRLVWAYFSTLNQLLKAPDRKNFKKEEKEILNFLKSKRKEIRRLSVYSKRDKLASLALSFGLPVYNLVWKLYQKISK